MNGHLARGVEHLALSEFLAARNEFDEALLIDPENSDAERYRVRTDSLIALRVDVLVGEGNWFRDRNNPATAIERYREAFTLRPDRDDLSREIARLEAPPAREASETPAVAAPAAPPTRELSEEERQEAERMYRSGLDAFGEGRNREAIRYFEFVYGSAPDFENVESYLKQAHLFHGMDLYTEGALERIGPPDPDCG